MREMTPANATALRRPFPPESVGKLPKGGQLLDFVGHAAVVDRLLSVDPLWSWEPFAVGPDGLPALDRAGNLWIRLTVCGVTRIGVGDGKNAKEVISDALRNAAMRFGVALDLWAKENLVEFAQAAQSPGPANESASRTTWAGTSAADEPLAPITPEHDSGGHPIDVEASPMKPKTRGRLFALFGEHGIDEDQQLPGINHICGTELTSRSQLTEAMARQVIGVLEKRSKPVREEQPA